MALEFDALLESLHQNKNETKLVESELNPIVVNNKRQFIVPDDYNTVIAYEGDVNSQLITFELPVKHEGHNLSNCSVKKLYWKNLSSNIEGVADLTQLSVNNEKQLLQWAVAPEAFSQAGTIELSISIQDTHNGSIGFAWNTATLSSLTVAETMNSVSYNFPPRDEILTIDADTRQIIAPIGYNNIAAYQGDVGINKVYFLIKRYIKGIDILTSYVYLQYKTEDVGENTQRTTLEEKQLYSPEITDRNQEGMVLLTWNMPDGEGELVQTYNGTLQISLKIEDNTKSWHTGIYSNLKIEPGLNLMENEPDGEIVDYLQGKIWHIDGNEVENSGKPLVLSSGLVSLRTYNPSLTSDTLVKNELLPEYDDNGNFIGLYLNTTKGLVNILDLFSDEYIIDAGTATELID